MTATPALGLGLPVSGAWATPGTMTRFARQAEELGYASLWTFQRLLRPVGTDLGTGHDGALDPLLSLALVAGHTERVRLGTATVCAPFTPPVVLAKAVATLDVLSGGRAVAGVGIGWMPQEYEAAGVPFSRRGERMEEYLHHLVAIWTQDPVELTGEFHSLPRSHVPPRPVQRPRPPLLVGGTAPAALRRAGRLADGWICSSRHDLTDLARHVATVRAGAKEAGRDPDAVQVLVRVVPELVDEDPGPGRAPFHGTREQLLDDLVAVGEQGATEVFLDLNLSPHVTGPGVDIGAGAAYADRVVDALAPSLT